MTHRIKVIIPIPMDQAGAANRAAQLPANLILPGFHPEFVPVAKGASLADSAYDVLLMDFSVVQAGLRAQEEGYSAICIDTVSDSGLAALRSRLDIPVIAPGMASFHTACMLGKKFSVITMWDEWFPLYEKTLTEYQLWPRVASLRSINTRPDLKELLDGKEEVVFAKLEAEARGKELAARQVHVSSANAKGPFVAINCAAIPAELFESELFGYAEGAFTSAKSGGKSGLLESANHGTFFMDEINSLPMPQQAKLLRVLQEREVSPVGARRPISLNIKFVAACNADLMDEVRAGRFREDLYYRISTFAVHIPPLRERAEDIPLLTSYLMRREGQRYGLEIEPDALIKGVAPVFRRYHWPGNVRQLENVVERLIVSQRLYGSCEAMLDALPRVIPELYAPLSEGENGGHLHHVEQEEIVKALQLFGGNKSMAAEYLGISQTTLWRRLKRLQSGGGYA